MRQRKIRDVGAHVLPDGRYRFRVWSPYVEGFSIHLLDPQSRIVPLEAEGDGYQAAIVDGVSPGTRYVIRFPDGHERPDPASRSQPQGVHGPSQVVAPFTAWTDAAWRGIPLAEYVFYEIHVGTFTAEGTFEALIPRLDELATLGITALEIMPIAEFPGAHNWGYDGVDLFAAHHAYGGPAGLARLVDACHARGLAVVLDVVYNHLGPEGNYLNEFGPYVTDKYRTPWGGTVNFDDAHSDAVRGFFLQNARQWLTDFHVDALRLDAVHAITDTSAVPFLAELAEMVHALGDVTGRHVYVIGESDLNDARVIEPRSRNGLGLDAQWSDDLHHALHALLTGETSGYYADFGSIDHLVRALRDGYAYTGDYSTFRQRSHGNDARHLPGERFVVNSQNHDQVGNRMRGERLSQLVDPVRLRLAACVVLLSPFLPLLFMGEDYGETRPFPYFVSHGDPALVQAVREGRRAEFAAFGADDSVPDPQDEATFARAKLHPEDAQAGWQIGLRRLYHALFLLRKTQPALSHLSKDDQEVTGYPASHVITLRRWHGAAQICAVFAFQPHPQTLALALPAGEWVCLLDASDAFWADPALAETPPVRHMPSQGTVHLALMPWACQLWQRTHERTA